MASQIEFPSSPQEIWRRGPAKPCSKGVESPEQHGAFMDTRNIARRPSRIPARQDGAGWRVGETVDMFENHACRNHSVTDVAFACGFADMSHFSRVFRQRFGMSPSEWRHRRQRSAA